MPNTNLALVMATVLLTGQTGLMITVHRTTFIMLLSTGARIPSRKLATLTSMLVLSRTSAQHSLARARSKAIVAVGHKGTSLSPTDKVIRADVLWGSLNTCHYLAQTCLTKLSNRSTLYLQHITVDQNRVVLPPCLSCVSPCFSCVPPPPFFLLPTPSSCIYKAS